MIAYAGASHNPDGGVWRLTSRNPARVPPQPIGPELGPLMHTAPRSPDLLAHCEVCGSSSSSSANLQLASACVACPCWYSAVPSPNLADQSDESSSAARLNVASAS